MKKLIILYILIFANLGFANENEESRSAQSDHVENAAPCTSGLNENDEISELQLKTKTIIDKFASDKVCDLYSKFSNSGINEDALKQALNYYIQNKSKIKNSRYISIADYSINSSKKRFYLLDTVSGKVEKYHVSHGSGKINGHAYGDPNHDGDIDSCKISDEQLDKLNAQRKARGMAPTHNRYAMTRPGFYTTEYLANSTSHDPQVRPSGAWPMISTEPRLNKLVMKGLVKNVNDDALRNGVVMHEAWYNTGNIMGRSFGCPAFRPHDGRDIMNKIKGGALYYAYVPKCSDDMKIVEKQIANWENTCN